MRIKLIGAFVVVAILAIAGVVAMRVGTTEARVTSNTEQRGALYGDGVSAQQREAGGKPYIGIAMTSVPDDADGALIVRVVEGSAAEGNLQMGDIITALDSDAVDGPRDVVDIVRDHSPGDVIVFTVSRDGASTNISITVGEREAYGHDYDRMGKRPGYGFGFFGDASERLILSDTRYMTDDGVKSVRKAIGTAQNINAGAGAFDLLLRDGSETLSFTISDDTKIIADASAGVAGIADLNSADTTMVVEVTNPDGTRHVEFIAQGDFSMMMHGFSERHGSDGFSPSRFFPKRWFGGRD